MKVDFFVCSVTTLNSTSPLADVMVVLHGLSGVNVSVVMTSEEDMLVCADYGMLGRCLRAEGKGGWQGGPVSVVGLRGTPVGVRSQGLRGTTAAERGRSHSPVNHHPCRV